MRFVHKWAYSCAYQLAAVMDENHQKRSVYYYGFIIILGALVKGIILVSVSLLLGILPSALLIVFVFGSLRMVAGGYHMDTYGKCILVSMVFFVLAGLTAQYSFYYWRTLYLALLIAVVLILGIYAISKYAPRDTPNKRITEPEEIRKFRRLSYIFLGVWLTAAVLLTAFDAKIAVLSVCFGVLLEMFTITATGHRFFDFIRAGLG